MRLSTEAVDALALTIIQRPGIRSRRGWNRRHASYFVVPQDVVSELWSLTQDGGRAPKGFLPMHLLHTLCYLKLYGTETVAAGICNGVCEDTLRKWVWVGICLVKDLDLVSQHNNHQVKHTYDTLFLILSC